MKPRRKEKTWVRSIKKSNKDDLRDILEYCNIFVTDEKLYKLYELLCDTCGSEWVYNTVIGPLKSEVDRLAEMSTNVQKETYDKIDRLLNNTKRSY